MPLDLAAELSAMGVAPMIGLDDALTAFEAAAFIGRNWARARGARRHAAAPTQGRQRDASSASSRPSSLLKAHGLRVPEGIVCTASEAAGAAEKLGFPVTLKVSSAAIAHKTEAGGVALNLRTAAEVEGRRAAHGEARARRAGRAHGDRRRGRTHHRPQVRSAIRPALVVGAGGILTELLKDCGRR